MSKAENGTDLHRRVLAHDHGSESRNELVRRVWADHPWVIDVQTDSPGCDKYREMCEWLHDRFGRQASPIHSIPGEWQFGGATIDGWTWLGFAEKADMLAFIEAWPKSVPQETRLAWAVPND
ncbi:MAG: hypothetical protein RLN67_13820 [Algiphilus sp.]|uniref:hypothetical protein n=1 Tax=Algiphilus sp. TaxID=1872431 RepID=UPI0032EF5D0F